MLPRIPGHLLRLIDPKTLVFVAALLAAIGLVAGYVEVHEQADRTLALRQGPPPEVAIQDFNMLLDVGPADEVTVQAEADFSKATVLRLRGSDPVERAVVVPLFALSDTGKARIESLAPGAGALTAQVARRTGGAVEVAQSAIGMIFYPLAPEETAPADLDAFADAAFGAGSNGMVVELNGLHVDPGAFTLMADGAFSVMGLTLAENYLAVRPFAGKRLAVLGSTQSSKTHQALFLTAMILVVISAMVSLYRNRLEAVDESDAHLEDEIDDGPVGAHPKFAPIPTQAEIIEAEKARETEPVEPHWAMEFGKSAARWTGVGLLALVSGLFYGTVAAVRWLKNRLLRREDEALCAGPAIPDARPRSKCSSGR